MLEALRDYGKCIESMGEVDEYMPFLVNIGDGDKITIASLSTEGGIKVEDEIEYGGNKPEYFFFYKGGNDAVGGTYGIQGVSPFFLKAQFFRDKKEELGEGFEDSMKAKIDVSLRRYEELYEGIRADSEIADVYDGSYLKEFLGCLKKAENLDSLSSLDTRWIFFRRFKENQSDRLHRSFIFRWFGRTRKRKVGSTTGRCSLCGENRRLVFPRLPFFVLEKTPYNINFKKDELEHSRLRLCSGCAEYTVIGWEILAQYFGGQDYMIIPRLRSGEDIENLERFHRIVSGVPSKFDKINETLRENEVYQNLSLNLVILGTERGKPKYIRKLVRNYKAFAVHFEGEDLAVDGKLKYVDSASKPQRINLRQIYSYFDLERLIKFFFRDERNKPLPERFHLYLLYYSEGRRRLPKKMDSSFKHRLFIYRDELFSFIYNTLPDALRIQTLNDICLNFLIYEIRNAREIEGEEGYDYVLRSTLMEGLNYYYYLRNKLWDAKKLKNRIQDLEEAFKRSEGDAGKIRKVVEVDEILIYYLIGQLIRKIDGFRHHENKNKVFSEFVQRLNRRSIEERFAEDILQKQNYYIDRLNPKAKMVFDLISNHLDELFEYEPYPEMLISIITGYYSRNLLGGGET